jgi:hypothetical protein
MLLQENLPIGELYKDVVSTKEAAKVVEEETTQEWNRTPSRPKRRTATPSAAQWRGLSEVEKTRCLCLYPPTEIASSSRLLASNRSVSS